MEEKFPEGANLQYIKPGDIAVVKKVFINNLESYLGSAILRKILCHNSKEKVSETGSVIYEVYGTISPIKPCKEIDGVKILDRDNDCFMKSITSCDLIIYDISEEWKETQKFLSYFQLQMENSEICDKKQMILLSTVMTWAQTKPFEEPIVDLSFRKRKAHPCFTNQMKIERDLINLSKKYRGLVDSLVICPGIVYGGRQRILHHIYKKCYYNNSQLDIFAPGTNNLPLIYIEDLTRILMLVIEHFPDPCFPYILAVQPETLTAKDVLMVLAEAVGGPETRMKLCSREEIFSMSEELMTQQVFNHLTLDLNLESEFLRTFDFEITGSNLETMAQKIADEFYASRNLKPLKILIDGSPYAYQSEIADMIATFYSLHEVRCEGFLENFLKRLSVKIDEAQTYLKFMKSPEVSDKSLLWMIEKVELQLAEWCAKVDIICERLKSDKALEFHEMQNFIINRLTSFGCAKHQGYVMQGFELDSEMASYLFLEPSENGFDFNESTKPDYVILIDRAEDSDCCDGFEKKQKNGENDFSEASVMKKILKKYYDTHYEEVSLLNFFIDRDVIPIEITFDRDQSRSDLVDIFESLKSKIGPARNYGLTKEEQDEIGRLKAAIGAKEAAGKAEKERQRACEELQKKEKEIAEWNEQMLDKNREEVAEIERHTLPTRHYLMKYIVPNISTGLTEVAKLRPKNAVQFLAKFMLSQEGDAIDDDPDLDEEIVKEFRKIVNSVQCEK